jgi:hypothetical protein
MFGQIATKSVFGSNPRTGVLAPSANLFAGVDPFAPLAPAVARTGKAKFEYAIFRSGPEVRPADVESASAAVVEVKVLWGATVLHVAHVEASRGFFLGDGADKKTPCDFHVAREVLGAERAPLVVQRGEGAALVVLAGAKGSVEMPGDGVVTLASLVASGRARPSSEVAGAQEVELPVGARATVEIEGCPVTFQVSAVMAGKRLSGGAAKAPAALASSGLSLLMHLGVVSVCAFFMPRAGATDADDIDRDQILMMQKMLDATAHPEDARRPDDTQAQDPAGGESSHAAEDPSGTAGKTTPVDRHNHFAIPRVDDNPRLARDKAVAESTDFARFLGGLAAASPATMSATWGHEVASGQDNQLAIGNLFGALPGEAPGTGGLGVSGDGLGGGGTSDVIGVSDMGGMGRHVGRGVGDDDGSGHGRDHLPGTHKPTGPRLVEAGETQVNGRIPADVIQRAVRANFGRFRGCYEKGLSTNPGLTGRVATRFVIDRTGAVALTADGGSDLPDREVVSCVVRAFGNLSFPAPDGLVTVTYPISFTPAQ